jgi:hypothetical protein
MKFTAGSTFIEIRLIVAYGRARMKQASLKIINKKMPVILTHQPDGRLST